MNFECTVATTSPIRRELTISVSADSIKDYMEEQFATLQKTAKIKGFRQGKVPVPVLKQYFLGDVKSEVFSKVVRDSYVKALEEKNIVAVGMPEIEAKSNRELKEGEPVTFVARVEVYPEIKLGNLSKLTVERPSSEVTDDEIEASITRIREANAELVTDERDASGPGAKAGDIVSISFTGELPNGQKPDTMKAENRVVELGAGQFMEEFEEGITGMKFGETKTFPVTFPEDFGDKQLAGQKVNFTVTVHEFKMKMVPVLDDELAKKFKCESALDLRKKVTDSMKEDKSRAAREGIKENLLRALIDSHEFEVPSALVQNQAEHLIRENFNVLQRQGFTEKMIREYLEKNRAELDKRATEQVKAALLLQKIAEQQNVKVEEADLDREFAKMAEGSKSSPEEVRKMYESHPDSLRQLRFRLREERTVDYALGEVKVVDAKPEEKAEKAEKKSKKK